MLVTKADREEALEKERWGGISQILVREFLVEMKGMNTNEEI